MFWASSKKDPIDSQEGALYLTAPWDPSFYQSLFENVHLTFYLLIILCWKHQGRETPKFPTVSPATEFLNRL